MPLQLTFEDKAGKKSTVEVQGRGEAAHRPAERAGAKIATHSIRYHSPSNRRLPAWST